MFYLHKYRYLHTAWISCVARICVQCITSYNWSSFCQHRIVPVSLSSPRLCWTWRGIGAQSASTRGPARCLTLSCTECRISVIESQEVSDHLVQPFHLRCSCSSHITAFPWDLPEAVAQPSCGAWGPVRTGGSVTLCGWSYPWSWARYWGLCSRLWLSCTHLGSGSLNL